MKSIVDILLIKVKRGTYKIIKEYKVDYYHYNKLLIKIIKNGQKHFLWKWGGIIHSGEHKTGF